MLPPPVPQFSRSAGFRSRSSSVPMPALSSLTPLKSTMAERHDSNCDQMSLSDAKPAVETGHLEHALQDGLSQDDATFLHEFPQTAHRKAFRKVDFRLMPMLMALYLIANLDRSEYPIPLKQIKQN